MLPSIPDEATSSSISNGLFALARADAENIPPPNRALNLKKSFLRIFYGFTWYTPGFLGARIQVNSFSKSALFFTKSKSAVSIQSTLDPL